MRAIPITTEQFAEVLPEMFAAWVAHLDEGELPAVRGAIVDLITAFQRGKAHITYTERPDRDDRSTTTTEYG